MQFGISTWRLGPHFVVAVRGDVDLATSAALREHLLHAAGQRKYVIVDLSAVEFMDATGVGALSDGYERATDRGTSFVLAGPGGLVRRVLDITRLDRCIPTYPAVQAAITQADGDGRVRTLRGVA